MLIAASHAGTLCRVSFTKTSIYFKLMTKSDQRKKSVLRVGNTTNASEWGNIVNHIRLFSFATSNLKSLAA